MTIRFINPALFAIDVETDEDYTLCRSLLVLRTRISIDMTDCPFDFTKNEAITIGVVMGNQATFISKVRIRGWANKDNILTVEVITNEVIIR